MNYPLIDPVIFEIGPMQVRWYGMMYIFGFTSAYLLLRYLARKPHFSVNRNDIEDLLIYGIIGLLVGARLGYCFFYNLDHYLSNPLQILAVWEGGLSFHGGLLGIVIAGFIFSRKRKKPFLMLADMGVVAVTPGLFFGRIGNFINGELFGRITDVPWGIVFPAGGPLPRHPSQLYEAFMEGIVLFCVLLALSMKARTHGTLLAIFLAGYGLFRFIIEFFREPDAHVGFIIGPLTMGQILCLAMIICGSFLFFRIHSGAGIGTRSTGSKSPPAARKTIRDKRTNKYRS